jgi:hypothetical protein
MPTKYLTKGRWRLFKLLKNKQWSYSILPGITGGLPGDCRVSAGILRRGNVSAV